MPRSIQIHPEHPKRTVLVVDDEFISREILGQILQPHYHVLFSSDGDEAMELLCTSCGEISVVLLDLMMPGINGLELLRIMKDDPDLQHIPVIVMTADNSAEVESLRLGALDFIPKPYSQPEVILARIRRIIELSEDREIIHSTERDSLTRLYNRDYFFRYAVQFDQRHPEADMDAIVIDINHFRMINERYGKSYGDDVLRKVSQQLLSVVHRSGGILCRRGADTFLVYCPHGQDYQAMLDAASIPLTGAGISSSPTRLRLRMGVYPHADKGIDIESRFDRAKLAADTVRNNYAQSISLYDHILHDEELYSEQLLEDFHTALEERQFVVYYQPKFDIRCGTPILASAEALVRWVHPRLGFISPGNFIPLFERNGLIYQLDRFVWREVAAQIRRWKKELGISVPVSVNVSRMDMYDPELAGVFQSLMTEFHLSPTEYLLEITESAYTQDSEQIIRMVNQLRSLGFQVEMDDFGTGYSSLNMLSSLPIDALKLDMQFLRNAFSGAKDLRMLELVIDIARYLSVPTIAEGVETSEQLHALKALGCDYVQGFYFSRPVPPEEFEPFLLERKRSSTASRLEPVSSEENILSSADISTALSSGYESVYYVDASSGHYVEFSSSGKYRELKIENSGTDFFGDTQVNLKRVVYEEDQTLVSAAMDRDHLLAYLAGQEAFLLTYRLMIDDTPSWYTLRASRATGKGAEHLVIGIGPSEKRSHNSPTASGLSAKYSSISKSLSSDFVCIYYVNTMDDTYQNFTTPGSYETLPIFSTGNHFFDECRSNLQAVVYFEDQPKVEAVLNKEHLLSQLQESMSVVLDYRLMIQGEPVFYRMKIARDESHSDYLVIGVSDISAQRQQEQEYDAAYQNSVTYSLIAQALSQDYFSIFYINHETDHFLEFSTQGASHRLIPERTGENFFSFMRDEVLDSVAEEDQAQMSIICDKDALLAELEGGQTCSLVFCKQMKGQSVHISLKALQLAEDPSHLVIGLRNIEAQTQREQEFEAAQMERTTYSRIAKALAQDYFSIYYVDTKTDQYVEYTPTGRYQELRVARKGTDFFQNIQQSILLDVYSADHSKAAYVWKKDTILRELRNSTSFSASYRQLVNREPVYVNFKVMKMQDEDDHHIIIGVSNIDAQVKRDLEFAEAQQMALRDDLTGVKNKRAYSQAEQTLNHSILADSGLHFAVVVCDINDLKVVNDTEGHGAGDKYIRRASNMICTIFNHSPVYRIGGDEFAVLLFGKDYEMRQGLMDQLLVTSFRTKSAKGHPLVSCGISEFEPDRDKTLSQVFERADNAMYQQKTRLKAGR